MSAPRLKCLRPRLAPAAKPSGWQPDSARGNRHKRGLDAEYDRNRKLVRQRANDLCEPHMEQGIVHLGTECDHIVPRSQGGTNDLKNLQWVCVEYHRAKTARESNRGGG